MAANVVKATLSLFVAIWCLNAFAIPPNAVDDLFTEDEEDTVSENVLDNDSPDTGGNSITVDSFNAPATGTFTLTPTGDMDYTPVAHFSGVVTFDYTIIEGDVACGGAIPPPICYATATGTIYLAPEADVPALVPSSPSGDEDTDIPLGLVVTPIDTDGSETIIVTIDNLPPGSSLTAGTLQGDGSYDLTLAELGGVEFTPAQDPHGSYTLSVEIEVTDEALDETGTLQQDVDSVSGGIIVTVDPVNDAPALTGTIPTIATDEDVDVSIDLAGIVTDPDEVTDGEILIYSVDGWSNTAIASASMAGSILNVTLTAEAFDPSGTIDIEVVDPPGSPPVNFSIPISVGAVNDIPVLTGVTVASGLATEDDPDFSVDFAGVFDDADIPTGDTLTYTAAFDSGTDVFSSLTMTGTVLNISLGADLHGTANVIITATDSAFATETYSWSLTVDPVNDRPRVTGSISNVTMAEDDPVLLHAVDQAFSDPDVTTASDYLVYEVVGNDNPGMFDAVVISGTDVSIDLAQDANGTATISIAARDSVGELSDPVDFTVTVSSLNDMPIAYDDTVLTVEDAGEIRISPLTNDYLPDNPHIISSVTQPTTYEYVNNNADVVVAAMGSVVIDGTDVLFTPSENFWGDVTFEYTIRDPQGEESTAEILVTVQAQNDAPEAVVFKRFQTFKATDLVVPLYDLGVRRDEYDIDNAKLDASGDPIMTQSLFAVFETDPPPSEGFLFNLNVDGTFTFRPDPDFVGVTSFQFSIVDNGTPALKSVFGTIEIEVLEPPEDPDDPTPGTVSVLFNLSNTPLEQASTVSPNVIVSMDDSGSMDWHITIDGGDDNARFVINNSGIATSNVRERLYTYLWNLPVNSYGSGSGCCGRILPTQESLPAGNDYNVWQARSASFNRLYYNPTVTYVPWSGVDLTGNDFPQAVPTAIRLDPMTGSSNIMNMLTPISYTSTSVPNWATGGGSGNVSVTNYYIPRYYTAAGVRVDIIAGSSYPGGPERDDCAGTGTTNMCTYAEEIQNFANWFQYYRSREIVAKAAIGGVVADLQDIRVGYETINRRSNEPIADMNEYYWEGEKRELLDTIYNVNSSGGTPLRRALNDAGSVLGCTHGSRPCPALPAPEGICQQNFTLLFSDGYWNGSSQSLGNADSNNNTPFDGGKYADTNTDVLADVAMHFYENDMFPSVDDGVPVLRADTEGAPPGTFSSPLMHQHMKTYTIAFGVVGAVNIAAAENADPALPFSWPGINSAATAKIDDMLHAAINGRGRFLNAGDPQELQTAIETAFLEFTQAGSSTSAAAFNSTSLREDTLLYRGFYDLRNRTGELTATEVNTTDGSLASTPTWKAAELLDATHPSGVPASSRVIATYDNVAKSGIPFRHTNLNTNQTAVLTANQVNYIRGDRTFEEPSGTLRQRQPTEGLLGDIVNSSPIFVGTPRAFNRDQEPYPTGTGNYFSDFVDNVSGRTPVVYVGANDGMLHGFHAETGVELFGYVPNLIIDDTQDYTNKLSDFSSSFYLHNYYVDLTPRLNDVYMRPSAASSKQWLTTIVGGLGAGGKGVFALNVTNPDTQFANETAAANAVLWEFSEADDTYPLLPDGTPLGGSVGAVTTPSGAHVKDLGYSLSLPVITMSNIEVSGEQEWVAIFGNGPNSTAGIATLFVLKMDGGHDGWTYGSDFVKIPTTAGVPLPGSQLEGYPNGLGSPAAVDIDLNGTVDLVYAGDRLGNLWRFDLRDPNQNNWEAVKVFSATYDNGSIDEIQPILATPLVTKHPHKPGFLVTVGTGSFVAEEDGDSTNIQSIYTIWDNFENSTPPTSLPNSKTLRLVEQVIENVVDDSITPAQTRRIINPESAVAYQEEAPGVPGTFGWYVDLDMPRATQTLSGAANPDTSGEASGAQFPGERAIRRFLFRDGNIFTTTVIPASDDTACTGARPGSILIFNALTGGDPGDPLIDFDRDGEVEEGDLVEIGSDTYSGGILFNQDDLDGALVDLSTLGGSGDTDFLFVSGGRDTEAFRTADLDDAKTGRQSWTQLREE